MDVKKKKELESYIESFKTVKKEKLDLPSCFIKSCVYDVTLNDGTNLRREKIVKGNNDGSAVIIVPVTKEKNTVLVVEPRVFTKRTVGVGFPSGYVESFEDSNDSALRELSEEIGYVPERIVLLGGFYQDSGCSSAYNRVFLAEGCKKVSNQSLDTDEYIKYFECSFDDVGELIDEFYIEGANSIIAYQMALKYMKGKK